MTNARREEIQAIEEKYLDRRAAVLVGAIDDFIADRVVRGLRELVRRDSTTGAWLVVRSPGGSVEAGLRIMKAMDDTTIPIGTIALERVEGMAAVILAHGARGFRTCQAEARIRLTSVWGGPATDDVRAKVGTLNECLVRDTGQASESVAEDTRKESSFTADEALAYGLVDRVRKSVAFAPFPSWGGPKRGPGVPRVSRKAK